MYHQETFGKTGKDFARGRVKKQKGRIVRVSALNNLPNAIIGFSFAGMIITEISVNHAPIVFVNRAFFRPKRNN